MRMFHCDHCGQRVVFENVECVVCKNALAYLPDLAEVGSLEKVDDERWKAGPADANGRFYRLCRNYSEHRVCNWAVPVEDPNPYCQSCRLTRVIPALDVPGNREVWYAIEVAKRRLIYSLMALGLPLTSKTDDPQRGLIFEFLADPPDPSAPRVMTGHADGVITLNIAEASPAELEKRRVSMHETYRTLLGHFRHEIGHYYWDRLIRDSAWITRFRELFGDEREDYDEALQRHHKSGPPADWQTRFISAYASTHPWEDWAETWAHFLHITDTLETATECGLALLPNEHQKQTVRPRFSLRKPGLVPFDRMMADWFAVAYLLNNLDRGLGQKDSYPFVLSDPVIEKLRLIHEVCTGKDEQPASSSSG